MRNRFILFFFVIGFFWLGAQLCGLGVAQVTDVQPAETDAPSGLARVWSVVGPIAEHLSEIALGSIIFAIVMAILLRNVVGDAIQKSAVYIFGPRVESLHKRFTEVSDSATAFFEGAQRDRIGRGLGQFLPSRKPTGGGEHENVIAVKLAESYRESGRFAEAIKEYEELLSKGIGDADIMSSLGITYLLDNKPEKAIELLTRATHEAPENPRICHNLGSALYKIGRHEEAVDWLNKSVTQGSENHQTFIYLGLSLWKIGKYEEAIATTKIVLDRTKEEVPDDAHWIALASNNVAYYLFEIAEKSGLTNKEGLDDAVQLADRACKFKPEKVTYIDTRGCIYLWEGKNEQAYECFERTLRMQPRPLAAEHLTRAAKLLGK